MAYQKRLDGRKADELRPIEAKANVIPNAKGSAFFRIGKTTAYAAVYGPRECVPRFQANPAKGLLRCYYSMMPFSGQGERIRPGLNRRAQEISLVVTKALEPVVDLTAFPKATVDVFISFPQTDAGSRCAAICAASIALADAGIPMKDLISSVAVGQVDGTVVADLSYDEEAYDAPVADIPVAIANNSGEVTLLQMDGELTLEQLREALQLARKVSKQIHEVQKKALLERFQ